jgi:hypothetical protein
MRKQPCPRTVEGTLDTSGCCDEDIEFSGFDLLNGADVQIGQFGKSLLGYSPLASFAAHACPEPSQFTLNLLSRGHAPLRRMFGLDRNGPMGRKMISLSGRNLETRNIYPSPPSCGRRCVLRRGRTESENARKRGLDQAAHPEKQMYSVRRPRPRFGGGSSAAIRVAGYAQSS